MEGFNISLKVQNKTLIGRTNDDMSIAAVIKESQTKDDEGAKQKVVVAHDVTFKASGLVDPTKGPDEARLTRDEIMDLALKTGAEAVVDIEYVMAGCDTYTGKAIITGYNEGSTADASADASYGLDLAVTGNLTKKQVVL